MVDSWGTGGNELVLTLNMNSGMLLSKRKHMGKWTFFCDTMDATLEKGKIIHSYRNQLGSSLRPRGREKNRTNVEKLGVGTLFCAL